MNQYIKKELRASAPVNFLDGFVKYLQRIIKNIYSIKYIVYIKNYDNVIDMY